MKLIRHCFYNLAFNYNFKKKSTSVMTLFSRLLTCTEPLFIQTSLHHWLFRQGLSFLLTLTCPVRDGKSVNMDLQTTQATNY